MSSHPTLPTPPEMEFSVTGMFRDCLSRQISEALRINNSTDVLLNSKGEYGHNSVSRLVVQEDAWVRREKDRLEEEQVEQTKKQVEMFKHQKMKQMDVMDMVLEQRVADTVVVNIQQQPVPANITIQATEDGQGGSVIAQTGTQCNIVRSQPVIYETDDEEFSDIIEEGTEAGQGGSVIAQTGTQCNIVKSKPVIYDTDEEEFLRPGDEVIKPAVSTTFTALYSMQRPEKKKNTAKRKTATYSLSYFTLWWMRMEVEGRKDAKRLKRMVEEETKCQKRKRKLRNIPENEKSEPNELVSGTDDHHELHKCTESSFLLLGEGATNKSSGVEEKLYMDGTNLDITERLPADSTDGWVDGWMESEC